MATEPNLRLVTLTYPKGTVTAVRGLINYLFGSTSAAVGWTPSANPADPVTGRRRRKYGTRQRSSSRAGENLTMVLNNGEKYNVRVTGTHIDFIDFVLAKGVGRKVDNIYSERGTEYGPQVKDITPG